MINLCNSIFSTYLHHQEHGNGAADASQSEGHESKLTARMTSQTQTEKKTQVHYVTFQDCFNQVFNLILTIFVIFIQNFKRKPGRANNQLSTGDCSEQIKKRLRTVEKNEELAPDSRQSDVQQESELYQHITQEEKVYDTQTYGQ